MVGMDAAEVIRSNKIMVHMHSGLSWRRGDLVFTKDRPFLLLSVDEASNLLSRYPEKFMVADPDEVKKFYKISSVDKKQ